MSQKNRLAKTRESIEDRDVRLSNPWQERVLTVCTLLRVMDLLASCGTWHLEIAVVNDQPLAL